MRGFKFVGITIIVLVLIFGVYVIGKRNTFIKMEEDIKASYAQVENQLKRRADLIPNLVNTVKGYAKHEKEIFENIANARAKLLSAKSPAEVFGASNELNSALGRLLAIAENYPTLKADATFIRLMDELAGTENRIAVERKRYNDAVMNFNKSIKVFPSNIIAGFFGFNPYPYFEVPEKEKETPKVQF
ncbi:MAG: LemA family protein [Proteobacteria bacterium]|nr:LemA family protein [Pseudomonadota bacterium]